MRPATEWLDRPLYLRGIRARYFIHIQTTTSLFQDEAKPYEQLDAECQVAREVKKSQLCIPIKGLFPSPQTRRDTALM